MNHLPTLPERPFFSCAAGEFAVVDALQMRTAAGLAHVEPLCVFSVGPGNVFERAPLRVVGQGAEVVTVECDGGETVVLDFRELAARKRTPSGEWLYRGGLDEANEGLGVMRAR